MPFSNFFDDIGGQLLQSSEEFLLCQLRQPSSRDATAQLFKVAFKNINFIFVTLDTFQLFSGWLKDLAPSNS